MRYPRNMLGYGRTPPDAKWPGGAYVAVQLVLNYEEGGENNILHGDAASEAFLVDVIGAAPWPNQRHANVESMYEYGARAGFWRLYRLFTGQPDVPAVAQRLYDGFVGRKIPVTVYGVATALMRAPQQLLAMQEAGWEIASHGYKWIQHKDTPAEEERTQIKEAIRLHTLATGERPTGWYTGRSSLQISYLQLPPQTVTLGLPSREQVNAQLDFNFYQNWEAFGAIERDLANSQMLDTEFGLGYEDECLAVSLAYRRKYTFDNQLGVPPSTSVM